MPDGATGLGSNVIELRGVSRSFGRIQAVQDVDLTLDEGEFVGLIGHNGAGKTTLFNLMLGLLPASSGEIRICGEPVRGPAFRRIRRSIGYVPESVALYDHLSGIETMLFFARLKGADSRSCPALLKQLGLADSAQRAVGEYSKGMRQRLGFAQALLGAPRILFLDEPTNGLDPEGIQEFYQIVGALRETGTTIVLSSHVLAEIQQRVDRLALMNAGRIQALGSMRELRERLNLPVVIQVTLHDGAEVALRRVLPHEWIVKVSGATAYLQCERKDKMSLLGSLCSLNRELLDIHIEEPSLEQVFLGYTNPRP